MATSQDSGDHFHIYSDATDATTSPTPDPTVRQSEEAGPEVGYLSPQDNIVESIEQDLNETLHQLEGSQTDSPRNSSGPSGDEAIFDDDARHSSPTTSHHSDDEGEEDEEDVISEIPDDVPGSRDSPASVYTPTKQRSPFRNTSSVREMQMNTTPPFPQSPYLPSPRSPRYKLSTPSRQGTPRSQTKKLSPVKKEYPLVLLHVTLLPAVMPYSMDVMTAVLPEYIMENYKLVKDKIGETVLERGILLPHPREDYELLEERLLESLEFKQPRILKCGHFHLPEDESEEDDSEQEEYNMDDDDADICEDCGRRVRDGRMGMGCGNKRWNIKVFAANGLMRAPAWAAAWREMERVDVEIEPWIPELLRRQLELRHEEEEEEQRKAAEEIGGDRDEVELEDEDQQEEQRRRQSAENERQRLREIYGAEVDPAATVRADIHDNTFVRPEEMPPTGPSSPAGRREAYVEKPRYRPTRSLHEDVPLSTLAWNYLYLTLSDKRNFAIALLSFVVLLLSAGMSIRAPPLPAVPSVTNVPTLSSAPPVAKLAPPSSSISQVHHTACASPDDKGSSSDRPLVEAESSGQIPKG